MSLYCLKCNQKLEFEDASDFANIGERYEVVCWGCDAKIVVDINGIRVDEEEKNETQS